MADFGQTDFGQFYCFSIFLFEKKKNNENTWKNKHPFGPRGAPKGGGPERVGPEGWGARNFALFFSLSRHHFALFLVVEAPEPSMCAFGVFGLSCEVPAAPEAALASHYSPRAQTCTFKGSGLPKTPPKFNEKTPRETQKERNGGGRGKKRAKFWAVQRRGSSGGGVRRKVVQ